MRVACDPAGHAQLARATLAPSRNGTGSATVLQNISLQNGALDMILDRRLTACEWAWNITGVTALKIGIPFRHWIRH
jgi:hypothetical protein